MHTQEQLKQLVRYDPETGYLYRFNKNGTERLISGTNSSGYIQTTIEGIFYYGHRLAWLIYYGIVPEYIDHANRDRSDNRLSNLRDASMSQNIANAKTRIDSVLGIKGVFYRARSNRYYARIGNGKNKVSLGGHDTAEQAGQAYAEAAQKRYGEFARFG